MKHLVRLENNLRFPTKDGIKPEIAFINSHDRSAGFNFFAGFLRLACMNGCLVGTSLGDFKVRHIGEKPEHILEYVHQVLEMFPTMNDRIQEFRRVTLNQYQEKDFIEQALRLRWKEGKEPSNAVAKMLHPRRPDDTGHDLFTVYQKTQENLIKGVRVWPTGTIRPLNAVDKQVKVNRRLWDLAEKTYQLAA